LEKEVDGKEKRKKRGTWCGVLASDARQGWQQNFARFELFKSR
jgi:hypothetical protein